MTMIRPGSGAAIAVDITHNATTTIARRRNIRSISYGPNRHPQYAREAAALLAAALRMS
jgi:hypothetical protein